MYAADNDRYVRCSYTLSRPSCTPQGSLLAPTVAYRGSRCPARRRQCDVLGLTGQRRLARDVEDGVRFRRPVLPPFDLEAGGVSRSNQAETMSF